MGDRRPCVRLFDSQPPAILSPSFGRPFCDHFSSRNSISTAGSVLPFHPVFISCFLTFFALSLSRTCLFFRNAYSALLERLRKHFHIFCPSSHNSLLSCWRRYLTVFCKLRCHCLLTYSSKLIWISNCFLHNTVFCVFASYSMATLCFFKLIKNYPRYHFLRPFLILVFELVVSTVTLTQLVCYFFLFFFFARFLDAALGNPFGALASG